MRPVYSTNGLCLSTLTVRADNALSDNTTNINKKIKFKLERNSLLEVDLTVLLINRAIKTALHNVLLLCSRNHSVHKNQSFGIKLNAATFCSSSTHTAQQQAVSVA